MQIYKEIRSLVKSYGSVQQACLTTITALFLAVLGLLSEPFMILGIVSVLLYLVILRYGNDFLIYLPVFLLIIVPYNISPALRMIVQIFAFVAYAYLFFFNYGFEFNRYPVLPKYIKYYFISLFVVMVYTTMASDYMAVGFTQIVRTLLFFSFVYVLYSLIKTIVEIKRLVFVLILSAMIYSLILFLQFASSGFNLIKLSAEAANQNQIGYLNPNALGGFLIVSISLSLAIISGKVAEKKMRYLSFLFLLISLFAMFITNSRAAILAAAVSGAYILYIIRPKYLLRLLIAAALAPLLLLFDPVSDLMNLYFRFENITSGRQYLLEAIKPVIGNHWLLGTGPGATKYFLYKDIPFLFGTHPEAFVTYTINMIEFGQAHVFYLFFFSDMGLGGLILSIALPVIFLYYALIVQSKTKHTNHMLYLVSVAQTGGGIGFFVRGLFEWAGLLSYGTLQLDIAFWIMFVIVLGIYKSDILIAEKKASPVIGASAEDKS